MSEEWRKKTFYGPRVLIDTERVLNPTFPEILLCLTGAQVEMLRNLMQYLHRRSTFAEDYTTQGYNAPDNDDWDTIATIVADLEEKLMATLCEELLVVLQEQADALVAMQACLCAISTQQHQVVGTLPDLTGYVDEGLVNYEAPSESYGAPAVPPTDAAKCELAQAFFYYLFELYTEVLLPFANSTADTITAALVAGSTFAGLVLWIGLPVMLIGNIVLAVIAWGVDGAIANFTNWLWNARDDIVCILYNNYPNYEAAASEMETFIDAAGTLSFLDKVVLKSVAASVWHMTWVSLEQQTNDTWGGSMIPGQCDSCVPLPPSCAAIEACDLLDWNGGTMECVSGRAVIKGGNSYYLLNTLVAPVSPAWITLTWIPRAPTGTVASIRFGVRDMSTETIHDLKLTGDQTIDVERMDYVALPAVVGLHECQLWIKQATYWGEPTYFCLTDVDPS